MSALTAILREPLLHFLVIGAAIFAAFALVDDAPAGPERQQIVITKERVEQLSSGYQSVWRRPPTESELTALVDDYIREEVLVREATALALDRNDAVIRRRLRQKMEFLTESAASAQAPAEEELRTYFDANADNYAVGARIGFDQVFLGENPTEEQVGHALDAVKAATDHALAGERTLLPPSVPLSHAVAIDGAFGRGFFEQLKSVEGADWSGPVRSGYGLHLVRITGRSNAEVPPLDAVRDDVLRDWRKNKASELAEAHFERILADYTIVRADRAEESAEQK